MKKILYPVISGVILFLLERYMTPILPPVENFFKEIFRVLAREEVYMLPVLIAIVIGGLLTLTLVKERGTGYWVIAVITSLAIVFTLGTIFVERGTVPINAPTP